LPDLRLPRPGIGATATTPEFLTISWLAIFHLTFNLCEVFGRKQEASDEKTGPLQHPIHPWPQQEGNGSARNRHDLG
jgi:hypothetical protein